MLPIISINEMNKKLLRISSSEVVAWSVKDLKEILKTIDELYDAFLALFLTMEFVEKNYENKIISIPRAQSFIQDLYDEHYENLISFIHSYQSLNIYNLSISSGLKVSFKGLDNVLKIVQDWIIGGPDIDAIERIAELSRLYPNEQLVRIYREIIFLKIRRKHLKQLKKYKKIAEKYQLSVGTILDDIDNIHYPPSGPDGNF